MHGAEMVNTNLYYAQYVIQNKKEMWLIIFIFARNWGNLIHENYSEN